MLDYKTISTKSLHIPKIVSLEKNNNNAPFICQSTITEHRSIILDTNYAHKTIINMEGGLIGFYILSGLLPESNEINIKRMVIHHKNKGIGKAILAQIITFAFQTKKHNRLAIDVFEDNINAIYIYKKIGFRIEGVQKKQS